MKTVPYIFWAVAGFLFGGCSLSEPEYVLVYRPEFRHVGQVGRALPVAASSARPVPGLDAGAVNLNTRRQFTVDSPYLSEGEVVRYELYYVDRHATARPWSGRHRWPGTFHGAGNLHRTFRYRRTGTMVR